jgi:peptidoglycan/LPS O-acetylase OafA/YrhL
MKRLPALDGLRGLAILMVLLSHSWGASAFNFWPHIGWSGVELFFVLSGFLITSILLDAKGAASYFRTFYARRILRIFPLYYAVIGVTFAMVAILPPAFVPQLGIPSGQEWTYWLFLSNFSMAASTFSLSAAGVTWSLAVEEQFYLVWAPIVFFLRRNALLYLCPTLYVTTLVWRFTLYATHGWTLAGLVLLPSQMDSLAVGAFVAALLRDSSQHVRAARWAPWVLAISAGGILATAIRDGTFYAPDEATWALSFSLYPLLFGSALTMAVLGPASGWAMLLTAPLLRTFGRYSYAIYLLHRPILIGMNMIGLGVLAGPTARVASQLLYTGTLIAISLLAGWLTWCVLERPIQRLKRAFETGESGADQRDEYVLVGMPSLLAIGPWRFERPPLGLGLARAVHSLPRTLPTRQIVLPGVTVASLIVVFLVGSEITKVNIEIALVLLAGTIAAATRSLSRGGFLVAAFVSGVALLATPHGKYLTAGAALVMAGVLARRALQRRSVAVGQTAA